MRGIGFRFFLLGAFCVTAGMVWGMIMAAQQDFSLAPAHAHLNLVGWVTLALFGTYYALTPQAAASKLAELHFWLAALGVALMVPGIALAATGGTEVPVIAGSLVTLAAMLIFVFTLLRHGLGRFAAAGTMAEA